MGAWGQHVGVVTVKAQDFAAAQVMAARRVEWAVDLVNCFADLIPYNYGWMYLAGEAGKARQVTPMINAKGDFVLPGKHLLPFGQFSWRNLERATSLKKTFDQLHVLASTAHRKSLGAAVVTSAAWCGRGTVERRRNQAFLLFAIALETLLLAGNDREEISYRFRVRGAHLLSADGNQRQLADELKHLYNVRSKIAHAGSYDVRDDDLSRIRTLAKKAVFQVLDRPDLHGLKEDAIGRWLDSQVLGG
jgi:hypothetical protein